MRLLATLLSNVTVLHFDEVTKNTQGTAMTVHVGKSGNVHHHFQKLLAELNKPTNAYELNVANRRHFSLWRKEFSSSLGKFHWSGSPFTCILGPLVPSDQIGGIGVGELG
ncbi:Serpin B3 [Pteropus alecto]|uniref:Serpin B3 n=1 Tax=Pteropus alecto TaxID=9402 RepID=L5KKN1_PTEAL|nr:Serpin B3 [Pteropus alecto]